MASVVSRRSALESRRSAGAAPPGGSGPRAASGSSSSSRSGSAHSARASATRCCSPPERPRTPPVGEAAEPDVGEQLAGASVPVAPRMPAARSGSATFVADAEVRQQSRLLEDDRDAAPVRRQRRAAIACRGGSSPAPSGARPAMARSSVVLPAPDGPTSAVRDPAGTTRSTPRRTGPAGRRDTTTSAHVEPDVHSGARASRAATTSAMHRRREEQQRQRRGDLRVGCRRTGSARWAASAALRRPPGSNRTGSRTEESEQRGRGERRPDRRQRDPRESRRRGPAPNVCAISSSSVNRDPNPESNTTTTYGSTTIRWARTSPSQGAGEAEADEPLGQPRAGGVGRDQQR